MFSPSEMMTFELFSGPHIMVFLVFLAISFFLIYFRGSLRPHRSAIKWTLFCLLVICEVSGQIWNMATDQWDVSSLPLQMCSFSAFISIYLFFKRSLRAFSLLYFIGFLPPILSMVTPELFYQFPHFSFLRYFLFHSAIPWAVLYFVVYEGYRLPKKSIWTGFLLANLIAVPIFLLNIWLDTNFFYLASPTEAETILSFFGSGVMYYINLEVAAIFVFLISYLPMWALLKRERRVRERG
ncbi:TIGR02206 family membrane protein [Falsibacillus pallidus]|uniref:Putative integral membrane protein (TIGR02206 family) n=1 Tax=Falsibacillus pallidus TaxID=493781 RepID=A0A370G7K2_9BACI|nr:TIGR02206 family membrane protein [Falsibacillus pallidus]RDI39190.1 putative integral membrane protein (TIGR02206 family) [Falsibacillus pallidus]